MLAKLNYFVAGISITSLILFYFLNLLIDFFGGAGRQKNTDLLAHLRTHWLVPTCVLTRDGARIPGASERCSRPRSSPARACDALLNQI